MTKINVDGLEIQTEREIIRNNVEELIASFQTTIKIHDELFHKRQHVIPEDLLPAFNALAHQSDGMIKNSGLYAFRLQIVKII